MLHTFPNRFKKYIAFCKHKFRKDKNAFIKNDTWNNFRDILP